MPNEDALGYYRFSLAPTDLEHLRTRGLAALGPLERMALVDSLHAGLERGTLSVKDALDGSVALARDPHPRVAGEAMGFLSQARDWLYRDPARGALEAYARDVFGDAYKDLGWSPGKDEDSDRSELRARVIGFLATTGQDLAVQALAKQYGRASLRTGLATATGDLETVKLEVLGQDADRPLFDQLARDLAGATDPGVRVKLLSAVSAIRSHELAARVRELTLTDTLRTSELLTPLFAQMAHPETRDATWDWVKQHWDLLAGRVASESKSDLLALAGSFCDEAHAADLSAFATPARMAGVDGGPRVLATTLESVHLCALRRRTEEPILRALFRREHAAPAPTHAAP
jgi:alanyl aminopeptidase